MQDSKRSERRPNREEKAAGRPPAVSVDAVEGADSTLVNQNCNTCNRLLCCKANFIRCFVIVVCMRAVLVVPDVRKIIDSLIKLFFF